MGRGMCVCVCVCEGVCVCVCACIHHVLINKSLLIIIILEAKLIFINNLEIIALPKLVKGASA